MSAQRLTFFRLVVRGAGPLTWACVTAILSAGLSVAPFWFLYKIVGALLAPRVDLDAVWRLGGYALLTLALRWALMAVSHVLAHRGAFAVQHRLRLDMARRLGEVPMSFFSRRGSGSLRRTLTDDVNNLEGFLAHMLPDMVASATVPIAALALLVAVDWRLTLAALVPLPIAVAVQTLLMRRAAVRMHEWSELQRKIADQVGEYVRGIAVVKAFGREASSFGALASAIRGAVAWVEDYARSSAGGWVVFTALLCANVVTVAPAGAWLYWRGMLDLPTYVLFLLVAPAVLLSLLRLTFSLGEQLQRAESLARINEVLSAPVLADAPKVSLPEGPLSLSFIDVRHRYDDAHARYALDGVSFSADAGTLTALVGASGSGKSTLARLLPRLYEYESGRVCVGGVDVRDWPLDDLLSRIGVVFQDVFLFHGTVADNLRLAAPGASMQALEAAARAARAHDFITALPQGYDTPIGERGATLSGGERQRLSIARALLKDAPILLLDEATASIDAENEVAIQSALQTLCKGRTVLMIAHRLRTIMHADRIVVLDAGRVAGIGRHEGLLEDCAAYRRLWNDHEAARDWALEVHAGVAREDILKERHA